MASDGLDISSIINQPRSTTAAAGDASEAAVINWDEDVGALMEEEDISDSTTELEQIQETDSLLESELTPQFTDADPLGISEEIVPEEEAPSLDVSDLFGDVTAEVSDDD